MTNLERVAEAIRGLSTALKALIISVCAAMIFLTAFILAIPIYEIWIWMIPGLIITGLAFIQNISFSMVSRSRNRDNMCYHIIASIFSNTIWFLTFRELIKGDMSLELLPFYIIGTISGSVFGVKLSMKVEQWLGATADGHITKK